jgi:hypothetical protein
MMTDAHRALLAELRRSAEETPRSGALNAGKRPYYPRRFMDAVERRAEEGDQLVSYMREKIYGVPTDGYNALIAAGHPELTAEAMVAAREAPWSSLFTDEDRAAASQRLSNMKQAHQQKLQALEAEAIEHDRRIVTRVSESRVAKGKPALTPQQEAEMLARMAAERAAKVVASPP